MGRTSDDPELYNDFCEEAAGAVERRFLFGGKKAEERGKTEENWFLGRIFFGGMVAFVGLVFFSVLSDP